MQRVITVSVVIPVYNDSAKLARCLSLLERQTYPAEQYEVIVVDNGSSDNIAQIKPAHPTVIFLDEQKPGSYSARNLGVRLARGEIVAFTDSDCQPSTTWLEAGVAALIEGDGVGLVAGRIDLIYRDSDHLTAVEIYEKVRGFPQRDYIENQHFGVTANLFTYKQVLHEVGLFDNSMLSGGDRNFGNKVYACGHKLRYCDVAVVQHPARSTLVEIRGKVERVTLDISKRSGIEIVRSYLRLIWPPLKPIREGLLSGKLEGVAQITKFVLIVLYVRWHVIRQRTRLLLGADAVR